MARVVGSVRVKRVPPPVSLQRSMIPDRCARFVFTTSRPTPRPESVEIPAAVEKPGTKTRLSSSRRESSSLRSRLTSPRETATSRMRTGSMPAPSSTTSRTTWLPRGWARRRSCPRRGFPARLAHRRRLDAVIDGVADDVHQRIAELLDDQLVQLDLAAVHREVELLARLARGAADQTGQSIEDLGQGDHARGEQPLLQRPQPPLQLPVLPRELLRPERGGREGGTARGLREPGEIAARHQQLAHQVHQGVQPPDVHAHRSRQGAQGELPLSRGQIHERGPAPRSREDVLVVLPARHQGLDAGPGLQQRGASGEPRGAMAPGSRARRGLRSGRDGSDARLGRPHREPGDVELLALQRLPQLLLGPAQRHQQLEGDRRSLAGLAGGERADELADGLQPRIERPQARVEVGERVHGADAEEGRVAAHALPQAVLLVGGEDRPHPRIQLQAIQRISRLRLRPLRDSTALEPLGHARPRAPPGPRCAPRAPARRAAR